MRKNRRQSGCSALSARYWAIIGVSPGPGRFDKIEFLELRRGGFRAQGESAPIAPRAQGRRCRGETQGAAAGRPAWRGWTVALLHDPAGDPAAAAAERLRLVAVVVAAGVDHQRLAARILDGEARRAELGHRHAVAADLEH